MKLAAEMFGWEAFRPGDVFYMNDSYMTGTHLNDATIFGPIYWRDKLVGFSATRAHWLDVGGKDAGGPMDSREIYQEGMRWAPTRIYDRGEPREDIIDLLRRNGRFGYSLVGDMNAQVAACRTGEARFQAILDRFGYDTYVAARDEIYRQSEQLEREAVAAIPDGTYEAEGFLDNDGLGHGPIPVKLRIDIAGDEMTLDLDGLVAADGGPGQLRLRPDGLGLPRRLQAADQPGAAGRRRNVPHARREGAAAARSSTRRSRRRASGTSARSGS